MTVSSPVRERFWPKVVAGFGAPHECWTWHGGYSKGYGSIADTDGRIVNAHRVAYERFHGVVLPAGHRVEVHHECENPACVNPAHLRLLAIGEHQAAHDGLAARFAARTHCVNGHPFAGDNVYRRPDGSRGCRACKRANERARYRRRCGS